VPGIVEQTLIRPSASQMGPITAEKRAAVLAASDFGTRYDAPLDRQSAYEILAKRADAAAGAAEKAEAEAEEAVAMMREFNTARRYSGSRVGRSISRHVTNTTNVADAMSKALIKALHETTGRRIVRGVFGGLFKER